MAQEIRALIEKYRTYDRETYNQGKRLCLAKFSIPKPRYNYYGPLMFEVAVLPVRVIKLFQNAINRYPKTKSHFYSGMDYYPELERFEIEYDEDQAVLNAWNKYQSIVPSKTVDVVDNLSQIIIGAYCEERGVYADEVIDPDELDDCSWLDALGVLEELKDKRSDP